MICDIHLQVPLIEIYWNPSFTGRFVTTSPEVSGSVIPDSTTDSPNRHDNTRVCFTRGQPITHMLVTGGAHVYSHTYRKQKKFSNVRIMSHLGQCHSNDLPFPFRISVGPLWLLLFAWCKNNSIYRIRTPQHLCGILVYLSVRDYCQTKMKKRPGVALVHDVSFLNILPVTSTNGDLSKVFQV